MALIRLTSSCNQQCLFCNFTEDVQPLSWPELKSDLDAIIKSGDTEIIFSGGEPTVYPDILTAINHAQKLGFELVELQTNGLLLAKPENVKKFKQAGLNSTFIGLHSAEAKIYDELTGVKGGFKLVIKALEILLKAGIKVRINVVINQKNYQHLLELTQYIHRNFPGIESIDYSFIVSQGKVLTNRGLVPKISEVIPYLVSAYQYCQENKIKFNNPMCGIPVCFISEFKNNSIEYLNLKRGGQSDFSEKNALNKVKLAKCQTCSEAKFCTGIWRGYINLNGEDEFKS
jgi:MoaA/NifB/PqqE/SkfB family radical SAM enzyme